VPTFGMSDRNTVQMVLYSNGLITVVYGDLAASEGVAGIAPGGGGKAQRVDFAAGLTVTAPAKVALAEGFQSSRSVDDFAMAQQFFSEFADDYDHLIFWFDFTQSLGSGAFAYEMTVKNDIKGIGERLFDATASAGSKGRLRAIVQMGSLGRYPDDPHGQVIGTNSVMDLLGQETGHRWGAHVRFMDGNGEHSHDLLGRDMSHWSFCHHTDASDMEGNRIEDLGDGRFTSVESTARFSALDRYLMGLIPAAEVPPFFYVDGCADPAQSPQEGAIFSGQRVDVTVEQVIEAEGQRVPPANKAPHTFNMAFVIIAQGQTMPSDETIAKIDGFRAAWQQYFAEAVDFRGAVDTTLRPKKGRR
jgi:hypothetical protein